MASPISTGVPSTPQISYWHPTLCLRACFWANPNLNKRNIKDCFVPTLKLLVSAWSIPFMRIPPSWTNHLPEASPPNAITLRVRFQHVNLEVGRHRPSVFLFLLGHSTVLALLLVFLSPDVGRGPRVSPLPSVLLSVLSPSESLPPSVTLRCLSPASPASLNSAPVAPAPSGSLPGCLNVTLN